LSFVVICAQAAPTSKPTTVQSSPILSNMQPTSKPTPKPTSAQPTPSSNASSLKNQNGSAAAGQPPSGRKAFQPTTFSG
jgi:hypothetical protein